MTNLLTNFATNVSYQVRDQHVMFMYSYELRPSVITLANKPEYQSFIFNLRRVLFDGDPNEDFKAYEYSKNNNHKRI